MSKNGKIYEPPKMKVYQFDDNDQILTISGGEEDEPDYAANALNVLMNDTDTNTTIE